MSTTNIFGPIVTGGMVEDAVKGSLEVWLDEYLGEMERLAGYDPGTIERPRGIITTSEFAKWPEDQIPLVLIINGGTTAVRRHEEGKHEATWVINAASIVSDLSQPDTRKLAWTFAGGIRAAVVQHKRLKSPLNPEGVKGGVEWVGERPENIAFDETRTLACVSSIFSVTVEDVVQQIAGPREVRPDPTVDPGPWPDVQKITVDVTSEALS